MLLEIVDPIRVAHDENGTSFLIAERSDIERGEHNGPAQIAYPDGRMGEIMPLQQFFKFGVWLPAEDAGD